jgi:very-short-patch-repair endonuclease
MARRIANPTPFSDARRWARSLGLKSNKEWRKLPLSEFPPGIPKNPEEFYGNEWSNWGDWLGTGRVAEKDRQFRSYSAACKWVRSQGIRSDKEWQAAVAAGRIPDDIPLTPRATYRKDWKSSGHFYGTGFVAFTRRKWRTLSQARKWAAKNHIYTPDDWQAASKAGLMPQDIPATPHRVYAGTNGFEGWNSIFPAKLRGGASFAELVIAKELSQFVKIDRSVRTIQLSDDKKKRVDIVIRDRKVVLEYDGAHWHKSLIARDRQEISLFLESGWRLIRIRESPLERLSTDDVIVSPNQSLYQRTCAVIRHLDAAGLIAASKKKKVRSYLSQGRLTVANGDLAQSENWLPFKSARRWARSLGLPSTTAYRKYVREHGLPPGVPSAPEVVYETVWVDWNDFLGTNNERWRGRNWLAFEEARDWVAKSGIQTYADWNVAVKQKRIPENIPRRPQNVYKNEWVSYPHWFGANVVRGQRRAWRDFESARNWARHCGATCDREWRLLVKFGRVPRDIPTNPGKAYREQWRGLADWLGKDTKR